MKFWTFPSGPNEPTLHRNQVKQSGGCYHWHRAPFHFPSDGHYRGKESEVKVECHTKISGYMYLSLVIFYLRHVNLSLSETWYWLLLILYEYLGIIPDFLRVIVLSGRYVFATLVKITAQWQNVTILEKERELFAKKVTLHKLPEDVYSGRVWICSIIQKNWKPPSYTRVCSDH